MLPVIVSIILVSLIGSSCSQEVPQPTPSPAPAPAPKQEPTLIPDITIESVDLPASIEAGTKSKYNIVIRNNSNIAATINLQIRTNLGRSNIPVTIPADSSTTITENILNTQPGRRTYTFSVLFQDEEIHSLFKTMEIISGKLSMDDLATILVKLNDGDTNINVERMSVDLPTKDPYETQADFDRRYQEAAKAKGQAEENSRSEYNRLFEAKYNGTEIIITNPGISYNADNQIATIGSVTFKAPTYNWYPAGGGSEQTSMAVGFSPDYLFTTRNYQGSATLSFPAVSLALEEAKRNDVVAEQGELILRFDFNSNNDIAILTYVEWRIQSTTLMRWDVGINATNLIPSLWPSGLTEVDEETGAISVTGFILNAKNGKYNEGELISVSGTVEWVGSFKYMAYYAGYRVVFKTTGDINVSARFDKTSEDIEQVKALQNGQKIIVSGKFDNGLLWDFLDLVDCSLLTSMP